MKPLLNSSEMNTDVLSNQHSLVCDSIDSSEFIADLPAAIYTCDRSGRITFFNQSAADLWGRTPELGKDLWCGSWKIFKTDGSPLPLDSCPMAVTLKEGRAVKGEEIIVERPDGRRANILPHPKPIFDASGKIKGAVNMLVDITDKREKELHIRKSEKKYRDLSQQLEERVKERTSTLKKSEERYHKMVEEVQDYAILLLDTEGNILNWNVGAERIKGYAAHEVIGRNFEIFYLPQDRKENLPISLIAEASKNGRAMHEGWRLKKNGEKFWGLIVITALHDDNNNIIGFSKVTRDLTERKIAEDLMRSSAHDIEFRNKQLEDYAHIASHDLQEPLRKIQAFGRLLERDLDNREAALKSIAKINSSATRMSALIKDILQYSQLSQVEDLFSMTDLNGVLNIVKENFELLIAEKQVRIIHSELPFVYGISVQLQQLFSNLIGNSLKFSTDNPVITITAEQANKTEIAAIPQLEGIDKYIKITFADNGIGFEPEYAEQIFKLFQRLDSSRPGTGIGLALCKKIVENHKGHIAVESNVNEGSIFTLFLPEKKSA